MDFSCEALILSGKNKGNYCGKKANFHIQVKGNGIHLCGYHNTRHKKQQRISIQIEENMEIKILTIPERIIDYCFADSLEKRRGEDYLPTDCWNIILNTLPESSKLLCKTICKHWNSLLKDHKTEKIDFGCEYLKYGYIFKDYFHELAIAYGINNINVDNFGSDEETIWLINRGAKFTALTLDAAAANNRYDLVDFLIKKGCKYTNYYSMHMMCVSKRIRELLINNNIVKLEGPYLISILENSNY